MILDWHSHIYTPEEEKIFWSNARRLLKLN